MLLELADGNNTSTRIFVPGTEGKSGWFVDPNFFDKLSNYEFSGVFSELLAFNPNMDFNQFIRDRDQRRRKLGLQPTVYDPPLSSGFGDWIKRTGKKIEDYFKPTPQTAAQKQQAAQRGQQPIPLIQPDGTITTVYPDQQSTSGFENLLTGIFKAVGIGGQNQYPTGYYPNPTPPDNTMKYLAFGGLGLLAYHLVTRPKSRR